MGSRDSWRPPVSTPLDVDTSGSCRSNHCRPAKEAFHRMHPAIAVYPALCGLPCLMHAFRARCVGAKASRIFRCRHPRLRAVLPAHWAASPSPRGDAVYTIYARKDPSHRDQHPLAALSEQAKHLKPDGVPLLVAHLHDRIGAPDPDARRLLFTPNPHVHADGADCCPAHRPAVRTSSDRPADLVFTANSV